MTNSNKQKQPKVRRSLGPDYTGMTCLACAQPTMQGLIDVNGSPYVSCEACRFRVLGMSIQRIAALRFFGKLLLNESVRRSWAEAQVEAMGVAIAPPPAREKPAASDKETTEVRRAS